MNCTYQSRKSGTTLEVDTDDLPYFRIWQWLGFVRKQQQAADRVIALYHPQLGMHDDPRRRLAHSIPRSKLEETAQDPFVLDRVLWSGMLMLHPDWHQLLLKPEDTPLEEKIQRMGNGTSHLKDPCAQYQLDPFTAYCLAEGEDHKKKDFQLKIPERTTIIKARYGPVP